MSFEPPHGDTIIGWILSGLGGGTLFKLADAVLGRKPREMQALGDAIGSLSDQLKAADERMDQFGERLDDCHKQHEDCEKGRKEDRREIETLKQQIERLMGGKRLPAYHLNAPKSDPGKGEGK